MRNCFWNTVFGKPNLENSFGWKNSFGENDFGKTVSRKLCSETYKNHQGMEHLPFAGTAFCRHCLVQALPCAGSVLMHFFTLKGMQFLLLLLRICCLTTGGFPKWPCAAPLTLYSSRERCTTNQARRLPDTVLLLPVPTDMPTFATCKPKSGPTGQSSGTSCTCLLSSRLP